MTSSNRDQDQERDSLIELLDAAWEARAKELHTAMPGHVVNYDPATRRAIVQPALFVVMAGETFLRRPPLLDVPVLHPSGGGFVVHIPLEAGDPVLVVFSERGIGAWKRAVEEEAVPDKGHLFNEADGIAIPGFRGTPGALVTAAGLCLQAEDGTVSITVTASGVTLSGGGHTLTVGAGGVLYDGVEVSVVTHGHPP